MASKASQFRNAMAAARQHEQARPAVECATGFDRIQASVSDNGTLRLRAVTLSTTSGPDNSKTVEVSGLQALTLARWLIATFDDAPEER